MKKNKRKERKWKENKDRIKVNLKRTRKDRLDMEMEQRWMDRKSKKNKEGQKGYGSGTKVDGKEI